MKVALQDIFDQLGVDKATDPKQLDEITDEQIDAAINAIRERIKAAKEAQKTA